MERSFDGGIQEATTWSIVLSVLMMLVGAAALIVPSIPGVAVTIVFGSLLVVSAILHLVYGWQTARGGAFLWELLLAIAYAAIGFYLLAKPVQGLEALTMALAIYLLVEGFLEFVLAFELRPFAGSGWLLVDGIASLLIAGIVWSHWPASSAWAIGTLVGVGLFFSGLSRLMLSMTVRSVAS